MGLYFQQLLFQQRHLKQGHFQQGHLKQVSKLLAIVIFAFTIVACGSGGSGNIDGNVTEEENKPGEETPEDNQPDDGTTPDDPTLPDMGALSIELETINLVSASADGSIADVEVQITAEAGNSANDVYLKIDIATDAGLAPIHSNAQKLSSGINTLSVPVSVPYSASSGINATSTYTATAYLTSEPGDSLSVSIPQSSASFSLGFPAGITPLTDVASVRLEIIPGSYSTAIVSEGSSERRVHYFSAQVYDQDGSSIGGLETDTLKYFKAYEDANLDVESGVTVDSRKNSISVYLVMDVSSSITNANAVTELQNAASQTVLSLSSFSSFDYREFSSNVRRINNLRELVFEEGNSGTALYRSIDSALQDIEAANPEEDVVVIAFTDGIDLASRNFYPEHESHSAVRDHVAARISSVIEARELAELGSLTTHFIGLGTNIDEAALSILANAGGGRYFIANDKENLENVFLALANLIKSTYRLEYSSQQLPSDTHLQLEVDINGLTDIKTVKGQ